MADTTQTPTAQDSLASRQIRVFLSSTFRDFMDERDLLVKQVFPELRRKARERGVEVVDVDLRWGITEEESRQGKVIPICLGEIDRCRPYFVGMLGERYGWIPPADQYSPDVIERQPWLKGHLGGVSVTELEILHGVLNDPAMAGRAFFYFRDQAWSVSQGEPGFVCETQEEEAKLTDLKQRIRTSGFPVAENIADPKALAEQIGRDLWELIEQQYPDLDEPDALEREERQHASYRRSRLGVYLGGHRSINQLERWIDAGQQKILITGESGAGKSALIANWVAAHQQNQPEDVVFAHHLGCSSDASAIRPLLARLIETAKQQLPEDYGYSLAVPQDWWELVAKAVEALQSLGRWAMQNNHRWIWVLDGLDRLDSDDQNALPWLPMTIPEGVVVVVSALKCPAKKILLERKFITHTIAPLKAKEQDALIQQYLGLYTKQLIAELRQTILSHPLAGSPLFLRVLLEELRQCGRYETLAEQLDRYLSAETIDDLYERVLERLEADGNAENVRKVMTALWVSRAGLSEEELLSITGLAPMQWAPIDLALEEALGRNGNRLVFDHDYLRKAVEDRYLTADEQRKSAYQLNSIAILEKLIITENSARNLIHCLARAGQVSRLLELLLSDSVGAEVLSVLRPTELIEALSKCKDPQGEIMVTELLNKISQSVSANTKISKSSLKFWAGLGELALQSGIPHMAAADCFELCLKILECGNENNCLYAVLLHKKAEADFQIGAYASAEKSLREFLDLDCAPEQLSGAWIRNEGDSTKGVSKESCLSLLGIVLGEQFKLEQAEQVLRQAKDCAVMEHGIDHPDSMTYKNNWLLAVSDLKQSDCEAEADIFTIDLPAEHRWIHEKRIRALGRDHLHTLVSQNNLALELFEKGSQSQALDLMADCLQRRVRVLGHHHQHVMDTESNLATFYEITGRKEEAIALRSNEKKLFEQMLPLPPKHLIQSMCVLVCSYLECDRLCEASALAVLVGSAIDAMRPLDSRTAGLIATWWAKVLVKVGLSLSRKSKEWQRCFDDVSAIAAKIVEACESQ